jgi:hypothetical protein
MIMSHIYYNDLISYHLADSLFTMHYHDPSRIVAVGLP